MHATRDCQQNDRGATYGKQNRQKKQSPSTSDMMYASLRLEDHAFTFRCGLRFVFGESHIEIDATASVFSLPGKTQCGKELQLFCHGTRRLSRVPDVVQSSDST